VEIAIEVMLDLLLGNVPVDTGHTENMMFAAPVEVGYFIKSLLIGFTVFPIIEKV
jgi:di/tricarboxylate transporter